MIAIVIPYYKIIFFEETLISLANQTNKRFKVYIGDDASPESPMPLLEGYRDKLDFVYHRFDENLGGISLVEQWKRCIGLTIDEDWIMILGDDDVLGSNVIESFLLNYEKIVISEVNLVRFASKLIDASGKDLSKIFFHPELELSTDSFFKKFQWESRSSLSEYIFKRTSFNRFQFTDYPLGWYSDDKAWLDFTGCGFIYTQNDALVKIRRSNENISGKTDNLDSKSLANYLFFKDILTNNKYSFNKHQKTTLLFCFGTLIKDQNRITVNNTIIIFIQFIKIGSIYNGLRFLRRMLRSKYLKK